MINMRNNSDIPNILTSLIANSRSPNHFYTSPRDAQEETRHIVGRLWLAATRLFIIAQKRAEAARKLPGALPPRWHIVPDCYRWLLQRCASRVLALQVFCSIRAQGGKHLGQMINFLYSVEEAQRDAVHRRRHQVADDDALFAQFG